MNLLEFLQWVLSAGWRTIGFLFILALPMSYVVKLIRGEDCRDEVAKLRGDIEVLKIKNNLK